MTVTARGANKGVRSGNAVARGADAPGSTAGSRITSASAATGFAPSTMSGFTSISVTDGWSSAMRASARIARDQCRAIHRRQAAEVVEQHARPDSLEHALDVLVLQRRHAERDVLVGLGEDSSDAEDDDGAEGGIALHADHELARSPDHPLDEEHGVLTFGERQKRASSGAHGLVPTEVQSDQPVLGLVADARSDRLDNHRTVEPPGDCGGLVLVAREATLGDGDPVAGEQPLRLPFVQRAETLSYRCSHDRGCLTSGVRRFCHHDALTRVRVPSPLRNRTIGFTPVSRKSETTLPASERSSS